MPGKFNQPGGNIPTPSTPTAAPQITRATRLDLMRLACQHAIEILRAASDNEAPQRLMEVRLIQEQIARVKNRHLFQQPAPSRLSWVDDWNPEQSH